MYQSNPQSLSREQFVHIIENTRFGAIERLLVKDGEPVFGPETILIKDRKFGRPNPFADQEIRTAPLLKMQFEQLFEEFAEIGNGEVTLLEFQHGLPFRIRTREPLAG